MRSRIILSALAVFLAATGVAEARGGGPVVVHGYVKSNGTVVQPHVRTAPDATPNNNWSTKPNVNPYTGKEGTKEPVAGK